MEFLSAELGPVDFTLLAAGGSVVAATVAHLLERPAARAGLVSRKRRDRFGRGAVSLVGGPALVAGLLAVLAGLGAVPGAGASIAVLGFFLLGLADDLRALPPPSKLAGQAGVALLAAWFLAPTLSAVGFGAVLFLLLVNAHNYMDNMDGLLPGVALVQAVALALMRPEGGALAVSLVLLLPALVFLTLPPARIYLGDSGSHLVGAVFAVDVLRLLVDERGYRPAQALPLVLLFAVPLADVLTVSVSRVRRGRPVFRGGTDHLSHRLVRYGFPVKQAVFTLVLASAVCGVAALFWSHS